MERAFGVHLLQRLIERAELMGIREQIAQQAVHALGSLQDVAHEFGPVAIQLGLIAPVQQLGVADDHANGLTQIVRDGIGELPELFVMAFLFGDQTRLKLVESRGGGGGGFALAHKSRAISILRAAEPPGGLWYPDRLARIFPFQPYRYSAKAGPIQNLVTQPYDKISPDMQARYLSLSPYNLVRIILGERFPADNEADNAYTRAAGFLHDWIGSGILEHESRAQPLRVFSEVHRPRTAARRWSARASSGWAPWRTMRQAWSIAMNRRSPARRRIAWNCCAIRARISARFSCCIPIRS